MLHVNANIVVDAGRLRALKLPDPPPGEYWDRHHSATLFPLARTTPAIQQLYRSTGWTPQTIAAVAARGVAWVHSCHDGSLVRSVRENLLKGTT